MSDNSMENPVAEMTPSSTSSTAPPLGTGSEKPSKPPSYSSTISPLETGLKIGTQQAIFAGANRIRQAYVQEMTVIEQHLKTTLANLEHERSMTIGNFISQSRGLRANELELVALRSENRPGSNFFSRKLREWIKPGRGQLRWELSQVDQENRLVIQEDFERRKDEELAKYWEKRREIEERYAPSKGRDAGHVRIGQPVPEFLVRRPGVSQFRLK